MAKSTPMTKAAAERIQSATAKANDGKVHKGNFTGRAQRTAVKNETKGGKQNG